MFFAVESDDRVIHSEKHLDIVVVVPRMPALPQGLIQLLFYAGVSGFQALKATKIRL